MSSPLRILCEVTERRDRVSPCRSAYFTSPWRFLTLNLRRHRREAASIFPEACWHLTMWGSRPFRFIIIPNTKRRPNNAKTDQLPISEVITGLPRPCHHTAQPVCWRAMSRRKYLIPGTRVLERNHGVV